MENEIRNIHFSEYGVESELVLKVPCHFLLLNDYAKFFNRGGYPYVYRCRLGQYQPEGRPL